MDIIRNLRQQPEKTRRTVVWLIVVIIGIGLVFFYITNARERLKDFNVEGFEKQLNFPALNEELGKVPKLDLPEVTEEDLEEFGIIEEGTTTPAENN